MEMCIVERIGGTRDRESHAKAFTRQTKLVQLDLDAMTNRKTRITVVLMDESDGLLGI